MSDMGEWTIMIYLAGDNDLSDECIWSLKEICRAGLMNGVNVLAQFDSRVRTIPKRRRYDIRESLEAVPPDTSWESTAVTDGTAKQAYINYKAGKSKFINRGGDGFIHREAKPVRPRKRLFNFLEDFIVWAIEKRPAKSYMLILSGHGSGAEGDLLLKGDNPPSFLSIRALRKVIERARKKLTKKIEKVPDKIDILGMDACSMSTVEVGYDLMSVARHLVAAEGFELNTGWPYFRVLEALNEEKESPSADVLAKKLVQKYVAYYSDFAEAGVSVDLAACDLGKIETLRDKIMHLGKTLSYAINSQQTKAEHQRVEEALIENAIILAHWRAQSYRFEDYVDLWDFCHLLQTSLKGEERIEKACKEVKDAVDACVLKSCYSGPAFQHSHGLSIYFPWSENISDRYAELRFSKKKAWVEFLKAYVKRTRRDFRKDVEQENDKLQQIFTKEDFEELQQIFTEEDFESGIRINNPNDRINNPNDKGALGGASRIKNPPVAFYKDVCQDVKIADK